MSQPPAQTPAPPLDPSSGEPSMMELAELSPSLAMEAAMALMRSPNPSTRAGAAAMGAKAAQQGSRLGRSRPLLDFMALMLSQSEPEAMAFAAQAAEAVAKRSGDLIGRLPAQRCLQIEKVVPGFASKARSDTLWLAPELAGSMRACGLASDARAYGAAAKAAAELCYADMDLASRRLAPGARAARQAERDAAAGFMDRACSADPGFAQAVFARHWGLNPSTVKGGEGARWGAMLAGMPMEFDPLAPLPAPDALDIPRKQLMDHWRSSVEARGAGASAERLGAWLGEASQDWLVASRAELGGNHDLAFKLPALSLEIFAFAPVNGSAAALTWLSQGVSSGDLATRAAKARGWLSLAEAFARSGAPAPVFEIMQARNLARVHPDFPSSFQTGMGCLIPLAGSGLGMPSAAATDWICSAARPDEARALSNMLGQIKGAVSLGLSLPDYAAINAALSWVEGRELRAHVGASQGRAPSRPKGL